MTALWSLDFSPLQATEHFGACCRLNAALHVRPLGKIDRGKLYA
jgi:hypothetical protein